MRSSRNIVLRAYVSHLKMLRLMKVACEVASAWPEVKGILSAFRSESVSNVRGKCCRDSGKWQGCGTNLDEMGGFLKFPPVRQKRG